MRVSKVADRNSRVSRKSASAPKNAKFAPRKIEFLDKLRAWQQTRASARVPLVTLARKLGESPSTVRSILNRCLSRTLRKRSTRLEVDKTTTHIATKVFRELPAPLRRNTSLRTVCRITEARRRFRKEEKRRRWSARLVTRDEHKVYSQISSSYEASQKYWS